MTLRSTSSRSSAENRTAFVARKVRFTVCTVAPAERIASKWSAISERRMVPTSRGPKAGNR
jgi:hypothetical protein